MPSNLESAHAKEFLSLIDPFNPTHIEKVIHEKGHILDHVITIGVEVKTIVKDCGFSDHFCESLDACNHLPMTAFCYGEENTAALFQQALSETQYQTSQCANELMAKNKRMTHIINSITLRTKTGH